MKDAGAKSFILHARKSMLTVLPLKLNLNIPKINNNIVYEIKKEISHLYIISNGVITKID